MSSKTGMSCQNAMIAAAVDHSIRSEAAVVPTTVKTRALRSRTVIVVAAVALVIFTLTLAGCAGATGSKEIKRDPVVTSPAIVTDGVLKVGVDSTHAPFAGLSKNQLVGIDVDIAKALSLQLGLNIELVDIAGKSADTLLNDKTIDIVMDVEQTGGSVIQGTQVGPYMQSGPALFTTVKSNTLPTVDLKSLTGTKIAAQKDSLSAWSLEELIGKGTADPKENLAQAFENVASGASTYAAADAVVGSYLSVDYEDLSCVKMLGTPIGVYVGVGKDNSALPEPLTTALRTIRDNGELEVILSKWLGRVSAQVVLGSQAVVAQKAGASTSPTLPDGQIDTGDDLPDPTNAGGTQ
ncbi:MAG: transporter substrate-binding domain-containing protein [Coriobacteriales bacterium]|jgi:polar amino acid transport system substrate-binding protein|nr:transporter substrate-binding domain-containing protein [Coriobacteriales bacterium]